MIVQSHTLVAASLNACTKSRQFIMWMSATRRRTRSTAPPADDQGCGSWSQPPFRHMQIETRVKTSMKVYSMFVFPMEG